MWHVPQWCHDGRGRFHKDLDRQGKCQRDIACVLGHGAGDQKFYEETGQYVGYKPAGGISKAKDALTYLSLIKEELGHPWLNNDMFRFGASSLLGDIERQLEHHVTGAYSATYRHALA